jgi:hypothetical protein
LAAAALSILGYSQLWGAMPDLLRQKLQAAPQPPWLCLRLPNDPAPLDVAVLGRWRQVWAGLQVADGCPLGYVVLYAGTAPLRSDIILDDTDEAVVAVRGLGQGRVSLRRITIDELRNWEGHLRGLEPPPRPDAAGVPPPLSLIASRVAEKVSQRRLAELRLAAIQRLLRGDADWYSSAA